MPINGTNSLVNYLHGGSRQPDPKVGDGATILGWTDRNPATIVEVKGNSVWIQADLYKRIDKNGFSESQEYEYTQNPGAYKAEYTKRKNGRYVRKGEDQKNGQKIAIGFREKYHDFSF